VNSVTLLAALALGQCAGGSCALPARGFGLFQRQPRMYPPSYSPGFAPAYTPAAVPAPQLWRLSDASGKPWQSTDVAALRAFVAQRNATLAARPATASAAKGACPCCGAACACTAPGDCARPGCSCKHAASRPPTPPPGDVHVIPPPPTPSSS
jgi:hypothetical protein